MTEQARGGSGREPRDAKDPRDPRESREPRDPEASAQKPKERDPREGRDEGRDRDETLRGKLGEFVPDMVKKAIVAGLGVLFTTEEGIRRMATDFSLPKEVVTFLIAQANTTKSELFKVVGREIHEFLSHVNLHEELAKLLTSLSFEI